MEKLSKKLFQMKKILHRMKTEISEASVNHLDTEIRLARANSLNSTQLKNKINKMGKIKKEYNSQKTSLGFQNFLKNKNTNDEANIEPYIPLTFKNSNVHTRIKTDNNLNYQTYNPNTFLKKANNANPNKRQKNQNYSNLNFNNDQPVKINKRTSNDIFLKKLEELNHKKSNKHNSKNMFLNFKSNAIKHKEDKDKKRCYYSFDSYKVTNILEDSKSILNKDDHNNSIYSDSHYNRVLAEIFKIYKLKYDPNNTSLILTKINSSYNAFKSTEKYNSFFMDFYQNNFCGYNSCWFKNLNYEDEIKSYIIRSKQKKSSLKNLLTLYKKVANLLKESEYHFDHHKSRTNNDILTYTQKYYKYPENNEMIGHSYRINKNK